MDEGSLWISAILFVTVGMPFILALYIFMKKGVEPAKQALGLFKINDFIIEKIRQAILAKCAAVKVGGLSREEAQRLIGEVARHAIAETFAAVYTGRPFEVTRNWPQVSVIISGNIAVIDIWIGHDYMADGEGIKPINVEVRQAPSLNLSTRRTIQDALKQDHGIALGTRRPEATTEKVKPTPSTSRPSSVDPRASGGVVGSKRAR